MTYAVSFKMDLSRRFGHFNTLIKSNNLALSFIIDKAIFKSGKKIVIYYFKMETFQRRLEKDQMKGIHANNYTAKRFLDE